MDKPRAAEHFLALFTTRQRAQEIVGDLLEQGTGSLALPVLRIAFALTWRWVLAILLVPLTDLLIRLPRATIVGPRVMGYIRTHPHLHQMPNEPWMLWSEAFTLIAFGLAAVTVLCVVRYGIRTRLAGLGLALTLLALATSCLTWTPHSAFALTAVWALALACALIPTTLRAPLTRILIAMLGFCLVLFPMRFVEQHPHSGHTHVVVLGTGVQFAAILLAAWLLHRTQRPPQLT